MGRSSDAVNGGNGADSGPKTLLRHRYFYFRSSDDLEAMLGAYVAWVGDVQGSDIKREENSDPFRHRRSRNLLEDGEAPEEEMIPGQEVTIPCNTSIVVQFKVRRGE